MDVLTRSTALVFLCLLTFGIPKCCAQSVETVVNNIVKAKSSLAFQQQYGEFKRSENSNTYWFSGSNNFKIGYLINRGEKCNAFIINNQIVETEGKFSDDSFACELDLLTFKIYTFSFLRHIYVVIQANNTGAGSSTNDIILNLFDITNPKRVKYFPLWSIFGSISCFGDFNKDNQLDFLKISYYQSTTQFKLTQQSLGQSGKFKNFQTEKNFITFQRDPQETNNGETIRIYQRKGFL